MNEKEIIVTSKKAYSKQDIIADLQSLSLQQGDIVLVHSSLSKIGWVIGRENTIVEALQEVVGKEGTIIMPCFSGENSDPTRWQNPPVPKDWIEKIKEHMPPFDPNITPTREMGRIANAFWHYPGVLRSMHPQVSFCGYGKLAHQILDEHPLTPSLGSKSPLAKLYQYRAKVLLLGVGYSNCTCLHLSEANSLAVNKIKTGAKMYQDGKSKWVEFEEVDYDDSDFELLGLAYEKKYPVVTKDIGQAKSKIIDLVSICDFANTWFKENRK